MLPFAPKIQLSVITAEILTIPLDLSFKKQLEELGCHAVHLLHNNRAVAINFTSKPLDRSLKGELFKEQLKIQGRVHTVLKPLYVKTKLQLGSLNPMPFDSLTLGTPDPRFEIDAEVSKGEIDKSYFSMSSYFMKDWQPMEMHIFFEKKSKAADQEATFAQIRQWYREAISDGFGDERMQPGELKMGASFTSKTSKKDLLVFPFVMPYPQPVTYPWLELWLRLRSGLPVTRRCRRIEFVNPS